MREYRHRTVVEVPPEDVYAWHARPGAFQRLIPPWMDVRLLERTGGVEAGAWLTLSVPMGPISVKWVARHVSNEPGRGFVEQQERGPFRSWVHEHRFEPLPRSGSAQAEPRAEGTVLEDVVRWELPRGLGGADPVVEQKLAAMLRFRHERVRADLLRLRGHAPMRVVVSGASGLVGSHLYHFLTAGGHVVQRLVRYEPRPGAPEIRWTPGTADGLEGLDGADAVVHLAGEPMFGGFWTKARKARLRTSRVDATRALAGALASMANKPKVLVVASTVGFYGHRGDDVVDEGAPMGEGFLAELARDWEEATAPAREAGIRVVLARMGSVLSPRGGLLPAWLGPARMGLLGPWGGGKQWVPWIDVDDAVGALHHALVTSELEGPVNVVAPNPVRNAELAKTLGRVLGRPSFMPIPGFLLRPMLGDLGEEMVLKGVRAAPAKLDATGYRWSYPDLETALRTELGSYEADGPKQITMAVPA